MKSIKQVIQDNSELKPLINAVIRQLGGTESIQDINNHGINGGYVGFTYYTDTCAFYKRYRKQINALAKAMAAEFGQNVVEFVLSFNCVNKDEADNVGACVYGGKLNDDTTQIENALAWFAAEEVCRLFEN